MDNIKVIVFLIDKVLFLYLPNFLFPIFSKNFPDRLSPFLRRSVHYFFSRKTVVSASKSGCKDKEFNPKLANLF